MSGRALGVLCAVIVGLAQAGCKPPTDPIPPAARRLLVQAVLDAGAPAQEIHVWWSQSGGFDRLNHVTGADVSIVAPDGQVFAATEQFQCVPNTDICDGLYSVEELGWAGVPVVAGGTYTLHVRIPTGDEVLGTTTVPALTAPADTASFAVFRRTIDTLRLAWPKVSLAKRYEVTVRSSQTFNGDMVFVRDYTVFADTSITLAGTARTLENDDVFIAGSRATVSVVAVDDNYYTYYHPNVDPFAGAPPSRLTGAIGLFGSIAPVRLRTYNEVR